MKFSSCLGSMWILLVDLWTNQGVPRNGHPVIASESSLLGNRSERERVIPWQRYIEIVRDSMISIDIIQKGSSQKIKFRSTIGLDGYFQFTVFICVVSMYFHFL